MKMLKREKKRGIALIMALWIMVALLVICSSFVYMMRIEMRIAKDYTNGVKAHYLAKAGMARALGVLRQDTQGTQGLPQTGTVDGKNYYNYKETDSLHEEWFKTFADGFSCDTSTSGCPMSWTDHVFIFGDGEYSVHLVDEASMMNINVDYGEVVGSLESLWYLLGGDADAAQKAVNIKDYRDSGGATTTYRGKTGYEGAGVKNYDYDTIREIQKVKEINTGGNPFPAHVCDLSVYSENKNHCMARALDERLNINTATAAQIALLPVDRIDWGTTAQDIVDYRTANGDYEQVGEVVYADGVGPVMIERLADVIKVSDAPEIEGTINANTATYWSLRSFYLLGDVRATNIIKTRMGLIGDKNGVTKPFYTYGLEVNDRGRLGHGRGELMNTPGLAEDTFDDYSDFVTVRSDRFRIVSLGKVKNAAGTVIAQRKIEAVVDRNYHEDGAMGPFEILYWSETVPEY